MKPADKAIRYQLHAVHRMASRSVPKAVVRRALTKPDRVEPAKRPGARKFTKRIGKTRTVVVIATETDKEFWVITTWWK